MTHLISTKQKEGLTGTPKNMAHTRCGKVLHRKWVLQDGPVECNDCIPTLAGMLKRLAGLPKEIRMAGKRLGVARA